jgi:pilus assembly protein CpaD
MKGESIMAPTVHGPRALARATRPTLTLVTVLMLSVPAAGCMQGPRMQAPFTLANPAERHPIKVSQGEALLDLSVSSRSRGLSRAQWDQLYRYLAGYQEAGTGGLVIKTPRGSANEAAAKRVYEDIRHAMRRAGVSPRGVRVEPYFAKYDPAAPLRLSYLELVAKGPDCPDWSENLARDPQNLPWPNMGCATQKNLAAMVADPEDFLSPHPEMPRPSERRDVVWGKYVNGEMTGSKWAADGRPLSEHANSTDADEQGN